jgi:hypothetical protein
MNPIFDLIVIGLIVGMVLFNLYFSRESSETSTTNLSGLRETRPVPHPIEQSSLVRPLLAAHLSLD